MPNRLEIKATQKHKILEGGRAFLNTLEVRLFVNDVTPSDTVMPTLADECADGGYLDTMPAVNPFPTVSGTTGLRGSTPIDVDTITFDHDGGDFAVYGVYFTDPADGDVTIMAQKMDVPFPCTAAGQVFVISGLFLLDTLEP